MKRIAFCFISVTMMLAASSCEKKEKTDTTGLNTVGWGVMKFDNREHDFGDIKPNEKVEHTFEFTNEGDTDLIITRASGSCGCTVPDYPKEPLAPGAKGKITVTFDPAGKTGKQHKTVTILANTQKGKEILDVKATIIGKAGEEPTKHVTH